jgi:hypothetical protein
MPLTGSNQKVVKAYEQKKQAAEAQGQPEPPGAVAVQKSLRWIPGWGQERPDAFAPLYLGGVDTLVWGFLASLVLGVGVSLATRPDEALARRYFPSS